MLDDDDTPVRPLGRATIHDVARAAGVTIGTASKALNGRGQLRAATRERVLAEASRLEFRPNDLVRSLLRGRTYTVGVLTTDHVGRFSGPVTAGIEDALGEAEILVFLCTVRDDPARERKAIDGLLAKQVDGLIVTGRRVDPRPPIELGRSPTPVVYAYAQTTDPATLCVVPDEVAGAALVTEHLISAGRRSFASITGPDHFLAAHLRLEGMRASLASHGLSLPDERVRFGPWSEAWGAAAIGELLDRPLALEGRPAPSPEIDAVVCGSDQIARGVIGALHERGVRVPEQVAVVGFDNWDVMAEATRPPLTTVDLCLHEIGREAGRHLLALIDGQPRSGIVRTPCRLVVRASCGSPTLESTRGEDELVTQRHS
jgi:LacI family transcriptional regulator